MSKRRSKEKKRKLEKKESLPQPKPYVSKPLYLNIHNLENKFYRADIEFIGVDHSGPSYEGRVFLNNPKADQDTSKKFENGYVGSYYVFGHGGCFGDVGHCDRREWRPFDYRLPDPLRPAYIPLPITEELRKLGSNKDKFIVTIVPVLARKTRKYEVDIENVVKLQKISIITYD
jgi:tyrosinase